MKANFGAKLGVVLIVGGFLAFAACAKKPVSSTSASGDSALKESGISDEDLARQREEELARQRALESEGMGGRAGSKEMFVSEDIYFDYDQSILRSDAQEILKRKAEWLLSNTGASVVIEGHCDERGSAEYNLALGDKRAQSAKTFLVNMGVPSSRMSTVSYGEEKPAERGHSEAAWVKNRRAHFTLD